MAPVDRKALRARMQQERAEQKDKCKSILYPMPDLRGPGGNAFNLLGQAQRLMKENDISESDQATFHSEATDGDYTHLLKTVQEWFTICVTEPVQYRPLPDDYDITTLQHDPDAVEGWEQFDAPEGEDLTDEAEIDESMDAYNASAEEQRRISDIQDKINAEVRAEFGLSDDEVVIVQIKKKGK